MYDYDKIRRIISDRAISRITIGSRNSWNKIAVITTKASTLFPGPYLEMVFRFLP